MFSFCHHGHIVIELNSQIVTLHVHYIMLIVRNKILLKDIFYERKNTSRDNNLLKISRYIMYVNVAICYLQINVISYSCVIHSFQQIRNVIALPLKGYIRVRI